MTNTDLSGLKIKELVGIHNGLFPDRPIKTWKGKRAVLEARIAVRRRELDTAPAAEPAPEATEEISADDAKPGDVPEQSARTIRAAAMELLCHVEYHEDRKVKSGPDNVVDEGHKAARSVGIPYDEIIHRIKAEFPDCQTTVACLRWYSVKIRVEELGYEGLRLPQRRPRAKSKEA